jgi:SPP1 gp7 family putative phage head morphogenesis protein
MPGDADILKGAFNLPPDEAIKYFEKKGYNVSFDWHEMKREAHTRAFTVAGVTQLDVLVDIRKAVEDAQKTGKSFESFKKDLQPLLEKKGWWGKKNIERPDGSQKEVDLSAPWRLKTIYRTNMRTAAMAGHFKGMKDASDVMPYWRYVAVMDGRTRDEHRMLHGKVLRHDDPFWDRYYPPNGWGCRCTVSAMTAGQLKRKGIEVGNGETMTSQIGHTVPDGWDYNPGKDAWLPNPKNYPGWAKEKVETIVTRAKEFENKVSFVGRVDSGNRNKVEQALIKHEQELAKKTDTESAIVVTKAGDVYRLDGEPDKVALKVFADDLEGAAVTHNHVVEHDYEYGFSDDDWRLFTNGRLRLLRAVDKNYLYQFTRDDDLVDNPNDVIINDASEGHLAMIWLAKDAKVGYRRWRK